ncbi:MAG: phage tail protein [Bacteroidales bacterium]|nr:phage tail protein [Bacteroidales bacterium]
MIDKKDYQELLDRLKRELLPVGTIVIYPAEEYPEDFLPCDGRELLKASFPALYSVIKDTYGGSETTFCLPDLQGRFVRGWDKEGNVDPERELGALQEDTIQGHGHLINYEKFLHTEAIPGHNHRIWTVNSTVDGYGHTYKTFIYNWDKCEPKEALKYTSEDGAHKHDIFLPDIEVRNPKSSTFDEIRVSNETRPKNIAMLYCIKVK